MKSTNVNDVVAAEIPTPPQVQAESIGFLTGAKEVADTWNALRRSREATASQIILALSLLGYVDDKTFNAGILHGYLEAIGQPFENRNGKTFFTFE